MTCVNIKTWVVNNGTEWQELPQGAGGTVYSTDQKVVYATIDEYLEGQGKERCKEPDLIIVAVIIILLGAMYSLYAKRN